MSDDPILASLARLEAGQAHLLAGQERLAAGQERLEADVKSLRADFADELGRTRTQIMEKVIELKGDLTRIRDDIAVNYGTADSVRQANDNTREELRALSHVVNGMLRQILNLQAEVRALKGDG